MSNNIVPLECYGDVMAKIKAQKKSKRRTIKAGGFAPDFKNQQQGTIALTDRKMTNDAQIALANSLASTPYAISPARPSG